MQTSCKPQAASCMRWRDASGFNLMELMITVAIIAILVAAAIPQYTKAMERNYRQQATDILTTIYYGEQAYRVVNGKFIPAPPWNDERVHRYHFLLYALDLERVPVEGAFSAADVRRAIAGHILAQATLTGTYTLKK